MRFIYEDLSLAFERIAREVDPLPLKAARDRVGGLTNTSKMPGPSANLPASRCQLGAQLQSVPGSVCESCYATKNAYLFPVVVSAMERRWELLPGLFKSLGRWQDAEQVRHGCEWISAMATAIGKPRSEVFRIHDSGDLQSPLHLLAWTTVARLRRDIRFWIPTREAGHVRRFLDGGGSVPPNMVVRLSVPMVGEGPSEAIRALSRHDGVTWTAVGLETSPGQCGAYQRGGRCDSCRLCWDRSTPVSYPLH